MRAGVFISEGDRYLEAKQDQPGSHGGPSIVQIFAQEGTPELYGGVVNAGVGLEGGCSTSW